MVSVMSRNRKVPIAVLTMSTGIQHWCLAIWILRMVRLQMGAMITLHSKLCLCAVEKHWYAKVFSRELYSILLAHHSPHFLFLETNFLEHIFASEQCSYSTPLCSTVRTIQKDVAYRGGFHYANVVNYSRNCGYRLFVILVPRFRACSKTLWS